MQLRSLRMRRSGQLDEGGVGVRAIFHARLVAGHQRRRQSAPGRRNSHELRRCATSAWLQQLRALLIGRRVVQLLVLLGGVVRVGDPAVDEWRRRRDAGGIPRSPRRSGSAESGTSSLSGRARARARATATFRLPRSSMARASSMSRSMTRVSPRRSARAARPGCTHIRAPWSSGVISGPLAIASRLLGSCWRSRRSSAHSRAHRSGMSSSMRSKSSPVDAADPPCARAAASSAVISHAQAAAASSASLRACGERDAAPRQALRRGCRPACAAPAR